MGNLFVCPGFCDDCNQKDCPMRDKLDEGFKKELADGPIGDLMVKKYEELKRFISPKTVVFLFLEDVKSLVETLKKGKEVGVVANENVIKQDLTDVIKKKLTVLDIYTEKQDQSVKKLFYSIRKISKQIDKYLKGQCNTLFCHDCCIFKVCHNEPVSFEDLPTF